MSTGTYVGIDRLVAQRAALGRAMQLLEAYAGGDLDELMTVMDGADELTVERAIELASEQRQTIMALLLIAHISTRELAVAKDTDPRNIRSYVNHVVARAHQAPDGGGGS